MRIEPQQVLIAGPAGIIDTIVEIPPNPVGIALVAHPHPLYGGTNSNKVVQTLAKTMTSLGFVAVRPNFRGVGQTEGTHDAGRGEADDLLAVLKFAQQNYAAGNEQNLVLCGFSFGAFMVAEIATRLEKPARRLILVGTAAGTVEGMRHYDTATVPPDTLVIHGADDPIVPLRNVLNWAQPMDLPIVVIPDTDHFFHRRLHVIRDIILRAWCR